MPIVILEKTETKEEKIEALKEIFDLLEEKKLLPKSKYPYSDTFDSLWDRSAADIKMYIRLYKK